MPSLPGSHVCAAPPGTPKRWLSTIWRAAMLGLIGATGSGPAAMISRNAVGEPARLVTPCSWIAATVPATVNGASWDIVAWPSASGPTTT